MQARHSAVARQKLNRDPVVSFRRLLRQLRTILFDTHVHAACTSHCLFKHALTTTNVLRKYWAHSKPAIQALTKERAILASALYNVEFQTQTCYVQFVYVRD